MSGKTVFDEIAALFAAHGGETYGEGVTIAAHSLQTAALARAEGANEALCLAALLHDVGHFLEARDDRFGYHKHDRSGGEWLAARFPTAVSEPVRLHVAAKRYLCATESRYFAILSEASQHSLGKQGGAMSAEEAAAFAKRPFAGDAVRLRRWDDRGKISGIEVPPFESYRPAIERQAR
ncbi:MAG TPA: HD domain-containing protein [Stellaceae bacterium]|nr:HD domain-containing protein [Stellaceae bacterium]